MKKKLSMTLILCLCAGMIMLFAGCGEEPGTEVESEKSSAYSAYDLKEYVKLPDYHAYDIEAPVPEKVTEEEMEVGIEKDLYDYGIVYQTSKGIARKGDTVTISYEGQLADGTKTEGMSSEEYSLTLGEGNMIEGFEEGLYGAKVGETTTVKAKFPDPYAQDRSLSGKDVVFKVKILNKKYVKLPELTDELIQEAHQGYYEGVEDYLAGVKKYYEDLHAQEAKEAVMDEIFSRIVEETEVLQYPEAEVNVKTSYYIMQNTEYASENQYTWEEYLKDGLQMTEEEFEASATAYAEDAVKHEMVVYAIAEQEGLEITEEEYEAGKASFLADTAMMTEEQFEEQMEMTIDEYAEKYNLECELLYKEAKEVLYQELVKSEK